MSDCLCDNLVIESCPPYASEKSFREHLGAGCENCSGVVPVATTIANLETAAEIDTCCEQIVINRGQQVIFSVDGGANWLETGVRRLSHAINFGAVAFTANVANTPNITTSTTYTTEIPVTYTSNRFTVTEAGNYIYHVNFLIAPNAALAVTNFHIEIMKNGVAISPRITTTPLLFSASATNLFYSLQGTLKLAANDGLSFRFMSGTTFTSSTTSVYIDMWKVGS